MIVSATLFAKQYDTIVFDIEAKLFPKMVLLEKNIQMKSAQEVVLVIFAQEVDFEAANELKNKIMQKYSKGILNKEIVVRVETFNAYNCFNIDAVIVLGHEKKSVQKIASWANKNKILSFAYDPADLENGILASIYIGKTTKPYLNAEVIKTYNFEFDSYLLQLSKFKD